MTLKKTRSSCWVNGIIRGLGRDDFGYGFSSGKTKNGKEYRRIRFDLQTSNDNKIRVECFGMPMEEVYVFSKDKKGEFIKVPWKTRYQEREGYQKPNVSYDICKDLDTLGDGASIRVKLSYDPNVYTNKMGEVKLMDSFLVENFYELETPVDLETNEEPIIDLDFIFAKVSGDTIKGFTVDFRGEATPVNLFMDDEFDGGDILGSVPPGTIMKAQGSIQGTAQVAQSAQYKYVETKYGKKRMRITEGTTQGAKRGIYIFYAEPTNVQYEMSEVWNKNKINQDKKEEKPVKEEEPQKVETDDNDWF